MKEKRTGSRLLVIGIIFIITVNCSMTDQVMNSINSPTPTITIASTFTKAPTLTKTTTSTKTPTQTLTLEPSIQPFNLIGIWKSDDMHAPDNSWNISYSIYLKFTSAKQYVYHGDSAFKSNQPTDEADIVYLKDSTFIKKIVYIPDHQEYLGKYQKWTWLISNGKVQFKIYRTLDSQEQALSDTLLDTLATGVKVEQ